MPSGCGDGCTDGGDVVLEALVRLEKRGDAFVTMDDRGVVLAVEDAADCCWSEVNILSEDVHGHLAGMRRFSVTLGACEVIGGDCEIGCDGIQYVEVLD